MKSLKLLHKGSLNSRHVIIFVHGFTGGIRIFRNKKTHFYTYLDKLILNSCDIYEFQYYSSVIDFSSIKRAFNRIGIGEFLFGTKYNIDLYKYSQLLETHYSNFLGENKSVNILCHSMGGLISKHFIAEIIKKGYNYNGFYISFATPHRGVSEAKLLYLLNNKFIDSMEPFSSFIEASTKDWSRVFTKVRRKYYCATHDTIVNDRSACPIDDAKYLVRVEGTHTTMVKPASQDSTIVKNVSSTIINFLSLSQVNNPQSQKTISTDDVLFYAYKKGLECYYLERKADLQVVRLLRSNNLWISGQSGTGKTNLIQHYLATNTHLYFNFDMSPIPSDSSSVEILSNLYWSLSTQLEQKYNVPRSPAGTQPWINYLSDLLCVIPQDKLVYLFIDELHIVDPSVFESFIDDMTTLFSYHKNRPDSNGNIRVIVSTIKDPMGCDTLRFKSKHMALFSSYTLTYWQTKEIASLLEERQGDVADLLTLAE